MEADQILVINNGVVAERGRHEELISAGGLYSELFARPYLTTLEIHFTYQISSVDN